MKWFSFLIPLALCGTAVRAGQADDSITVSKAHACRGIIDGTLRDFTKDPDKRNTLVLLYRTSGEFAYDWVIWARQSGNIWICGGYHWDKDRWFGYDPENEVQKEKLLQFVKQMREIAAEDHPVNSPLKDMTASTHEIHVRILKGDDQKYFEITEIKAGQANPAFKTVNELVDSFLEGYLK